MSHRWSSGRIVPCHGTDPGSIPGRCKFKSSGFCFYRWGSGFLRAFRRIFIDDRGLLRGRGGGSASPRPMVTLRASTRPTVTLRASPRPMVTLRALLFEGPRYVREARRSVDSSRRGWSLSRDIARCADVDVILPREIQPPAPHARSLAERTKPCIPSPPSDGLIDTHLIKTRRSASLRAKERCPRSSKARSASMFC